MADNHTGTTVSALEHYFGNHVTIVRVNLLMNPDYDSQSCRDKFIAGLEKAVRDNLPEEQGVTQDHLREVIELARGDWKDIGTIKELYRRVYEIAKEPFDEPGLFRGK